MKIYLYKDKCSFYKISLFNSYYYTKPYVIIITEIWKKFHKTFKKE